MTNDVLVNNGWQQKVDELGKAYLAAYEELKKWTLPLLEEAAKHIFEKYPMLETFSWSQYANAFNDGGPCPFEVRLDDLQLNEEIEYDFDDESGELPKDAFDYVYSVLDALHYDDDIFESIWGDSNKVIVKRTETGVGIVTEYADIPY